MVFTEKSRKDIAYLPCLLVMVSFYSTINMTIVVIVLECSAFRVKQEPCQCAIIKKARNQHNPKDGNMAVIFLRLPIKLIMAQREI